MYAYLIIFSQDLLENVVSGINVAGAIWGS